MAEPTLYPLKFSLIYQYRLCGGRRLVKWLATPLPGDRPVGEASLMSDRDVHPRRERLFVDPHFHAWRLQGEAPLAVGAVNEPRVLACLDGAGSIEHEALLDIAVPVPP